MDDSLLLRYHRHILLPQIDHAGQQQLFHSKVLIIGLGGLGSPVAMYLAAAGVGNLTLVDSDAVELTNLQRQIIHDTLQLGQPKTTSARHKLQNLNPTVQIITHHRRFDPDRLDAQVQATDAVVDCSDNFTTRFAINLACVRHRKPLISGAAIRWNGQITVFLPDQTDSPCYRCLYPDTEEVAESCSDTGVIAPLVGIIGSIQAVEVIKVLLHLGQTLSGRLLLFDGYTMQWRTVRLPKDPACPVCQVPSPRSPL